jgi:lipopolysaccharide/colanic/teichoic acid biosynthesis glycosyltransferase
VPRPPIDRAAKRAIDLVGGTVAFVLLSPILAGVALAILVIDGRPVLFRQRRPGRGGDPFTIMKFRTMRPAAPGEVWYRTDEQRLTRLGRFLRTTSLDELPELWHVMRGEMSLVGPRPLLMEYLETYSPRQARRHEVRPGITSWAIVNGRHGIAFDQRLELDTWYVEHWSLRLDARILGMTVSQVLRRTGVAATQEVDEVGFPLQAEAGEPADTTTGPDAHPGAGSNPGAGPGPSAQTER